MDYTQIKTNSNNARALINKLQYISKKVVKQKCNMKFLLKCRKSKLVPNFIKNSTKCNSLFIFDRYTQTDIDRTLDRHTYCFHTKILSLLIKQKHNILKRQQQQMEQTKTKLKEYLNAGDFEKLLQSETKVAKKLTTTLKKRQEAKHDKLRQNGNHLFADNNKNEGWFVNKTKVEFPSDIQTLLTKGPKFALPIENTKFPLFKYIADGENLVQTIKVKEKQDEARTKLSLLIKDHTTTNRQSTIDRAITDTVGRTRKFLSKNKNIRILTSDKGNKTVAMDISDYNKKMGDILNDLTMYRVQRQDPTSRLQSKNNSLVDKLYKLDLISKIEKNKLSTTTALPPRIYGLPKLHKEGTPLRPICSATGSPAHNLCKYIADILKSATANSAYNIKNTLEFKTKIKNTYISDNEKLISFDVISLFPSIPTQLALEIIRDNWMKIEEHTNIPKKLFMEILTFCIEENRYFKFNDILYTQLKGLPMGSPTSPVIADIVMEKLLENTTTKLARVPRLLTKYVDDLFAIIHEDDVKSTLDTLNSFNKYINFTMELEEDGKLPYLDSVVIRSKNELKLKWYKKSTSTGRIINFYSKHPKTMIMNTAMGCIRRMLEITDDTYHEEIKNEIKLLLRRNDFPENIIKTLLNKYQEEKNQEKEKEKPQKIFKSVAYVPKLSERLAKSDCYNKDEVKIAHKPINTLKNIYNQTKSKIPHTEKSNIVYEIPCNGKNNQPCHSVYIGTTKGKLKTRLAQHKSDYKYCQHTVNQKTALMTHCTENSHSPNFDKATILQQEQHYRKRFTLEMLHIINTPTSKRMNYKTDVDNSASFYRYLLTNKRSVINSTSSDTHV
ncbi:uncharacterized protein [Eurosta solidaginis]|uniref:uncharacterized protein n=1 Tax=Eurosta solidaginis TaxID=178769 RepID=UPI0035308496